MSPAAGSVTFLAMSRKSSYAQSFGGISTPCLASSSLFTSTHIGTSTIGTASFLPPNVIMSKNPCGNDTSGKIGLFSIYGDIRSQIFQQAAWV